MEGPSLVILKEELQPFLQKEIINTSGSTKQIDIPLLKGNCLARIETWGKHLILLIGEKILRVHFLMFGSYRINESKDRAPRLSLVFENGVINFYSCSIREISRENLESYDWEIDVLSERWDKKKVKKLILEGPEAMVCDILMNQNIFAGVGNIIKNEVLFELKLLPQISVKDLSTRELEELIEYTKTYCEKFYEWKKQFVLKKNWKIFRKQSCPICKSKTIKEKTGESKRISYFCANCQSDKKVLSGSMKK